MATKTKEAKKTGTVTHAPVENKVHIVTWNEILQDFWCKELPGDMTDEEIYRWLNANITGYHVKIYRGKELVLRGRGR